MKLLRTLSVTILLFSSVLSFAQLQTLQGAGNSVVMKNNYATIEGSPYLYKDYRPGTVTNVDGQKIEAILLKYDAYGDKIVVFKDNSHLELNAGVYPKFTISFFDDENGNVQKEFLHSSLLGIPGLKGYYEILYDGEYKVLRKYGVEFINKVVSDYGTTAEVKRFDTTEMLILISPNNRVQEVKGGKGSIYELFSENEDRVKNFAKKNDLNVKESQDLIMLIEILEREGVF
jgi:hypothetical protein